MEFLPCKCIHYQDQLIHYFESSCCCIFDLLEFLLDQFEKELIRSDLMIFSLKGVPVLSKNLLDRLRSKLAQKAVGQTEEREKA